jgi:hypothetical protein
MKKTMGALGAIFTAAALFITGCESPTMPDPIAAANDELTNEHRTVQVDGSDSKITSIDLTQEGGWTVYNVANAEFDINFNYSGVYVSPDKEALEKSLEIYELVAKDGGIAANAPNSTTGSNLPAEVVWVGADSNQSIPRIRVNLSGVTHSAIRVRIKADTFTANGGRYKLNLDDDLTAGESDDDWYGSISVVSKTTTPLTAVGSVTIPNPQGNFSSGLFSNVYFETTATLLNQLKVDSIPVAYRAEDFKAFLDRIKIEKYDPASGTWTLLANAVFERATDGSFYTAPFTSEDGNVLRARITGLRDGWTTTNSYYGFPQKYTTKDNNPDEEVIVDPDLGTWSSDLTKYTDDVITNTTANASVVASNNKEVYVVVPLNGTATSHESLGSVTQDTVKIIGTTLTGGTTYLDIKWESHSYAYATWPDSGDNTEKSYPAALLLKLPESYKYKGDISFDVYITPDVTASAKKAKPDGFYTLGVFNGLADKVSGGTNRL